MSNIEREKCLRKVPIYNTDFLQHVFNIKYDYENLKLKKFVKRIKNKSYLTVVVYEKLKLLRTLLLLPL